MVRLNYVNRKNDGPKLGQIIAKDVLKRITGSGLKAALRDPDVELDVTGKALTDEGTIEAADALAKAIAFESDTGKVVKLEELNLRGNLITSRSLVAVKEVIRLASKDLKDLDLSNNLISISTTEDAEAWEDFLSSFSECCMLRRIDFSGNPLGHKAFEILYRVYSTHSVVDAQLIATCGHRRPSHAADEMEIVADSVRNMSMVSDSDGYAGDIESASELTPVCKSKHKQEFKSLVKKVQPKVLEAYSTTYGLRSVPYMIFSETGMNETCALYLSYVVASHLLPEQLLPLVPPAKAGLPSQQLEAYDTGSSCRGIVYFPNPLLNSAAKKVLALSERPRGGTHLEISEDEAADPATSPKKVKVALQRASEAPVVPLTQLNPDCSTQGNRRKSSAADGGSETGGNSYNIISSDIDRARSRIQGNTLKDLGPQCNDLWSSCLGMLPLSRAIFLRPHKTKPKPEINLKCVQEVWQPNPVSLPQAFTLACPTSGETHGDYSIYAPLASKNPNKAIVPRPPQTQDETRKSGHLRNASSNSAKQEKRDVSQHTTSTRSQVEEVEVEKVEVEKVDYRSGLLGGLSKDHWQNIISLATGAKGLVNDSQQKAILAWAMDRATLMRERENLRREKSAQIWKVLDWMGCLNYHIHT